MKDVKFKVYELSNAMKVSKELLQGVKFSVGTSDVDFIQDTLTVKMDAYVLSHLAEERVLTYYCDRPKFFDWLFRRNKTVKFDLEVRDLMLNPPKLENTVRFYDVNLK